MRARRSAGLWHRLLARLYHLRGMAHRHLGHLQGDVEEYRWAVVDFTQALRHDPGFVQARYDRALLLWRELGDGVSAEQDLTQVLELDPERVEAWFNRAHARRLRGDTEGAIADFERYLAEGDDPEWRGICQRQVRILRSMGGGMGGRGDTEMRRRRDEGTVGEEQCNPGSKRD